MTDNCYNVLILCTGNSARSIIGEALVNLLGDGRLTGFSAGSSPAGKVNPFAISLLAQKGFETARFRSKSWDEFSASQAPKIDFVFTVCDNAAGETCPLWHGTPLQAHWGIPDPAAITGSDAEKQQAFETTYNQLHHRIKRFSQLQLDQPDQALLQKQLNEIGETAGT
jgi:arsenate reductase